MIMTVRRAVIALGLIVAGCEAEPVGEPPLPWVSGTRIRAQEYTATELVAFAGRMDLDLDFRCAVDEQKAPWFFDCPHEVWLLWSATDCSTRNVAVDRNRTELDRYACAAVDGVLRYYDVTAPFPEYWAYDRDAMDTCTTVLAGPGERTAVELPPDFLQLGVVTQHSFDGVDYELLETDDGFSLVTSVGGGSTKTDSTSGRIRARWSTNGAVRAYRGLYDSELETNCVAATMPDSTIACVPDVTLPTTYEGFTSPTCDQGSQLSWIAETTRFVPEFSNYRPGGRHIERVLECGTEPGPVYAMLPHMGCVAQPNAIRCREVPSTTFATLTLSTL
jgi:hypothetical protein